MKRDLSMHRLVFAGLLVSTALVTGACSRSSQAVSVEHGRYLVKMAGCNDCHTSGYLLASGAVPESQWLLGDSFGWHGPWGTTYATNLRLLLGGMSEEEWLVHARSVKSRPPMPWFSLNEMREADLRSIYRYVRQLGAAGVEAPAYLPPGVAPPPPFASFPAPPAET